MTENTYIARGYDILRATRARTVYQKLDGQ